MFIENYAELLNRVRVAVFELHDRLCDTHRCMNLLADAGFSVQLRKAAADSTTVVTVTRSSVTQTTAAATGEVTRTAREQR